MLASLQRKAKRKLDHWLTPIGPDQLRAALDRVTGGGADILLVHSSLSACGRFTAGPSDVLQGFRERCGVLCLPTHTYCYPEQAGEPGPLFDPTTTPSQNGKLTEIFRKQPDCVRSMSATHSLAASGVGAKTLTSGHHLNDTPCGAGTPYDRLLQRPASVLLFGVTFHSYTLYHTAEDASGSDYAYEKETEDRLRVIDECGKAREYRARRQTRDPRRFAECGVLLEKAGLVRRAELGRGVLLFVRDCAKVHDFLIERLRKVPDFLYRSCTVPLA
jgi:aminoglycoside 3-N-acetyltransferase